VTSHHLDWENIPPPAPSARRLWPRVDDKSDSVDFELARSTSW
jgi:hypothetical protein